MDLTNEELQIVVNLLNQISVPVNQASTVLTIISKINMKLQVHPKVEVEEVKASE